MMETDRLLLREPSAGDVEALRGYYRRNAARFAGWEPVVPDTAADMRNWIAANHAARHRGRATVFCAFDPSTGAPAGIVSLHGFSAEGEPSAMLSYSVDAAYEGRGYAAEAVRRVIAYADEELGLRSLFAYYHPDNVRSGRLLERLGFAIVSRTPVIPGFEHLMQPQVVAVLTGLHDRQA